MHRGDKLPARVAFQHIAPRARGDDLPHELFAVVHGEDQDLGFRQRL